MKNRTITILIALSCMIFGVDKTTIAVFDLTSAGISGDEAIILTNRVRSQLINTGSYIVVDRANMEEILTEQGFQQTGCTSDECVVEVGNLLGVQNMMSGTVGKIGSTYSISLQIVNIETGQIIKSSSYDYKGEIEGLLTEGINSVLHKVLGVSKIPTLISSDINGYLKVSIEPKDANVEINGESYRSSELNQISLMPGFYSINIKSPYYCTYNKEIQVTSNAYIPLNVELKSGRSDFEELKKKNRKGIISSTFSFVAAATCAVIANQSFSDYNNSENVSDISTLRDRTVMFDNLTLGFSLFAGGVTVYTIYKMKDVSKLKTDLGVE